MQIWFPHRVERSFSKCSDAQSNANQPPLQTSPLCCNEIQLTDQQRAVLHCSIPSTHTESAGTGLQCISHSLRIYTFVFRQWNVAQPNNIEVILEITKKTYLGNNMKMYIFVLPGKFCVIWGHVSCVQLNILPYGSNLQIVVNYQCILYPRSYYTKSVQCCNKSLTEGPCLTGLTHYNGTCRQGTLNSCRFLHVENRIELKWLSLLLFG